MSFRQPDVKICHLIFGLWLESWYNRPVDGKRALLLLLLLLCRCSLGELLPRCTPTSACSGGALMWS
jgi:hypothetical protein